MFANIGNLRLQKYILLHAPATQEHLCKLHLCVGQRMGRLMYVQQKRHCRQENISYILWMQIQNSSYTDTLIQSYLTWIRVGQIHADTRSHRNWLGCVVQKAMGQQTRRLLCPDMIGIHDVHDSQSNHKKCSFSHCQDVQVNTAH